MDNLREFLCESETGQTHILFVDEIHSLPKEMAEFMYPLLEDFMLPIGNIKVRPFIFIGATTEKILYKRNLALLWTGVGVMFYWNIIILKILNKF